MIVVEEKLRSLFSQIPEIELKPSVFVKPCFSWGDELALSQFMEAAYKVINFNLYPLIWLLPTKDEYNINSKLLTKKVSLVLSTLETRTDVLNDQRLQGSYRKVLNPLVNYVIQSFKNSSITRITNSDISVFKHPNYSINNENGSIDKWDVIRLDLEVEFNNNCLKPIRWRP